ncbi:hemolysin III family protein [Xanthomonas campestris pv. campestris]|uniref:Hemeolysin III n=1 Tax=Xanthomonas campestris pv. campestris (strain B100) TaxID=509169 RepID=B0RQA9_XANCB|nr:hemolysin III family protein [Xanthomonas campestris]ALE69523.1 hemolysin III [Xanthomonas campestris pv. campestris]MDO0840888.1 hemolysin III family protein [Xanthomonas campestris pv. campestris]MEA0619332.1 hemolysin III family protein [Xanthomonas campestris pv. campestris]MEA0623799.1 hemolysin III family protein [Xanthomonas campestris pv. campestris]MEA0645255.1 hemolysin III family protein [Xanthomonas campestris pv. campestris]
MRAVTVPFGHECRCPPSTDLRDEIASAVTHGLGAIAALAGGSVLITLAAIYGDGWQLATTIVFSATLILLYVASTLFHAIPHVGAKARLQVLDHCAIYLLIAGTYTPFMLINLRGPWGWSLFAAIWTIAAAGVIFKLFFTGRFRLLSTILYLAMGWLIIVAIKPLLAAVDTWSLCWLLAGGLFYTLGTYFYQRDTQRYFHAIWHLFVLAGSACHFVAVTAQIV